LPYCNSPRYGDLFLYKASPTVENATIRYGRFYGIEAYQSNFVLSNSSISNSGYDALNLQADSSPTVTGNTISDNGRYGLYTSGNAALPVITNNIFANNGNYALHIRAEAVQLASGNTFSGSQANNTIYVQGGTITSSGTWRNQEALYLIAGPVRISHSSNPVLTIAPGNVLKFNSGTGLWVGGGAPGKLMADGTTSPILFTTSAITPTAGSWHGLIFEDNADDSSLLKYVTIEYGGQEWLSCLPYCNSPRYGDLFLYKASPTVENATIRYGRFYGIEAYDSSTTIRYSNIYGNPSYGIYNQTSISIINAENNWWGTDSGPAPYGSGNGINYRTYTCGTPPVTCYDYGAYVDAVPWLGQQVYYGQSVPNVIYVADPVNTATGNYAYQRSDLSIPTRGLPLDFTRAYNSLAPEAGSLGYGWRHSWQVTAYETASDVRITYGDGRQIRFTPGGGGYVGDASVFATLVKSGGVFHLTEKNQTVYHFDAQGRLASVEDKNGNATALAYDGQGRLATVTEPAGRALTFEYASPVSTTLISRITDHTARTIQLTYNVTTELTSAVDVTGATTSYTYGANHRLLTVTDANAHTFVRNVYNANGRVVEQYDALNKKWVFAYDEPNHKTVVTDPLGRVTTYQYDANLRLSSEKDALNQIVSYAYDAANNRAAISDKRNQATHYIYDDRGNTTGVAYPATTCTFTDDFNDPTLASGWQWIREDATHWSLSARPGYLRITAQAGDLWAGSNNDKNLLVRQSSAADFEISTRVNFNPSANYQSAGLLVYTNDDNFVRLGRVYADGQKVELVWETNGSPASILVNATLTTIYLKLKRSGATFTGYYSADGVTWTLVGQLAGVGLTTPQIGLFAHAANSGAPQLPADFDYFCEAMPSSRSFAYDSRSNLLSERDARGFTTTYQYDANSNLTRRTDPLAGVTTWAYTSYGQVSSTTDALGNTTSYAYNANGDMTSATNALGQVTSFTYDAAGRKLSETDALGRVTSYTYDAANRLLTISEPLGKTTTYTYDLVGNRTSITDPRGGVTTFVYDTKDRLASVTDPLGHTTTYGYDAVNNQTSVTDPLGHTTTTTYDQLNRRTAVSDALNHVTSYQYDANGNRTATTDANGQVTQYAYDELNRLVTVTDAAGGVVRYTYDPNGNRAALLDANAHTTTYAYDELNRLITVTDPLGHVVSYTYDRAGNRIRQTKADGTILAYTYDALNRLIESTDHAALVTQYAYDAVGNRKTMTDALNITTYTYDALNRLTQITDHATRTTSYGYDLNSNRTRLTYPDGQVVAYTYDLANRLTTVTDHASRITTYTYDDANRQTGITYPNGVQAASTYDDANRLLSLAHTHPTHGTITTVTYTVDNVGNRLTMVDPDGATAYTYDALHRLKTVAYPDGELVTYAYDPMGNRTSMTSSTAGATTYAYDAGDRLRSFTDAGGATALTWDANGNMTGKGAAVYTFDALDRLTEVVSGTTTQFAYNGDGVRVGKTVNGTATSYVQDLAAPLPVVLSETTGGQTDRYVYGNDLLTLVSQAGVPAFYHADGLGSTRALSNLAGQRTDAYSYDAFGATRSHTGSSGQSFTFAGEQGDGEVGLVFLRARYYDAQIGRFVSQDPHPGVLIDPQSFNKYAYAGNNPVLLADDDGRFIIPLIVIGVVGYSAYQAWDNFLDRANQMETNMRGYYQFDFENPEWQQKYENYNPAKDYASTLAAGVHAGVSTPGTSLSGPPPGITGSIGTPSLITTLGKKFMNWLFGFKGPEPYRFDQGQVLGQSSAYDYGHMLYTDGGFGGGGGGSWGNPPSKGK
jgi:RHS repeat-associated protein